jgi:hypothetical protein
MDRKIRLGFLYDRKSWIGDAKEPVTRICCQIGLSEKLLRVTGLIFHESDELLTSPSTPHLRGVFDTRLGASAYDISECWQTMFLGSNSDI